MPDYDTFLFLYSGYISAREIAFFDDIDQRVTILRNRVEGTRNFTESDEFALFQLIQENWKRALMEICNSLIDRIESRITRGQTFYEYIQEIEKKESQADLNLDQYLHLFKRLGHIKNRIEEKIGAEKFNIWLFIIGLIIGFGLGLLSGYVLKIWGVG